MRLRLAVMLGALVLAGCLGDGARGGPGSSVSATESQTSGPGPGAGCDVAAGLPVPPTWAAHGGAWGTFIQPDLGRPHGFRGAGAADPGLSLLVDHSVPASSAVDAGVDLALVSGRHPDGAGLAFHWSGASYNLVRYSPSEAGWHLFTVVDGERTKANATYPAVAPPGPAWCAWTTLRVLADGRDVQAFQDGQLVLQAALPEGASTSGEAGLFVRGDSVALFAGYARAS